MWGKSSRIQRVGIKLTIDMRHRSIFGLSNVLILCVIIFAFSGYFTFHFEYIGFVLVGLSVVCLLSLIPFKIPIQSVQPDVIFGIIDNGILALFAVIGAEVAGVAGAIVGGVAGNAITDGVAGVFEGDSAERLRKKNIDERRTVLGSAVGKMSGCLLGAGVVLILDVFLKTLFFS